MAVSWSKILEMAPRVLMGLLPGMAGAGLGGRFATSAASRVLGNAGIRGAFTYPAMTSDFVVADPMAFGGTETTMGGKKTVLPAMNGSTMDRRAVDRVLAQTLADHNRAVADGTEKNLEEWWPGEDTSPRGGGVHPKSTAVKGIKIRDDGAIQIQFRNGKGKWYTYRGGKDIRETTEKVKDLLTYPSIGRALAHGKGRENAKLAWPNSKHLNSEGKVDKTLGFTDTNLSVWRDKNYEDDQSKWGN